MDIDAFVGVPLLVSAIAAGVLFLVLLFCVIRNTSRISFIFFIASLLSCAGLLVTYFCHKLMYLTLTVIVLEFLLIVYALVLALGDPKKRENRKTQKELEEVIASMVTKEEMERQKNKYTTLIATENELISKVSGFFTSEDTQTDFFQFLNKFIMEKTGGDGAIIMTYDEQDEVLNVKTFEGKFPPPYKLPEDLPHKPMRVESSFKYAQFKPQGNIFGDIFSGGKVVNITNPQKDSRVVENTPEDFLRCGPYLFMPMQQDGEGVALFCVSRAAGKPVFSEEEVNTIQMIIETAKVAFRPLNAFLSYTAHAEATKEGGVATKYQKVLLPEKLPVISKLSLGKFASPAENVCGDYFDIIPYRKDRISFVLGDIAGKGMKSLVVMAMVRAMLRLVSNTDNSAATLLDWINQAICTEEKNTDHFASISLINYNSETDAVQLATGGNNPVLLYKAAEGEIKKISTECDPVGVDKTTKFSDIDLQLEKGDIIVTCTDGAIECLNEDGVQYSLDSLMRVVKANAKLAGKDIANKVKDGIKKFCGSSQQFDDMSLLVIKIQ